MSDETLEPPLPPIDARTEAVAERLFGLKFALRKDDPKHIHDEWEHAADWIHDGYLRQAIEVLAAADQIFTVAPCLHRSHGSSRMTGRPSGSPSRRRRPLASCRTV